MNNLDLKEIIRNAQTSSKQANVAVKYYDGEHDILKNRIIYINDKNQVVEDVHSSNIRIPHPFFTELVQQSTDFIFSEPVKFQAEPELLQHLLDLYITNDTHRMLYEAVEEASKKGKEWIYAYRGDGGLINFMNVDARQVAELTDEYGNTTAVIRYFDDTAQMWDDKEKKTYKKNDEGDYVLVDTAQHTVVSPDGNVEGYGRIPWFKLKNNKDESDDLKHIKPFIDDYDIMSSYASNDLMDFRGNVHVLKGGGQTDIKRLKINTTNTGAISIPNNGDYKVESHVVSIQSRLDKMEQDKQNIYEIGQGYNTSILTSASGNVTNEALKAGQRKLVQKCKQKKTYLRMLMDWMLDLVLDDIERRGLGRFSLSDIAIEFTHDLIENEKEKAEVKQIDATAVKAHIDVLLSVEHILDELTMLEQVSKLLGLSVDEVKARRHTQDYGGLLEEG